MKLLLMQHGAAVSKDGSAERPLTDEGRNDMHALAALLAERGILFERVVHSGKLRARQTAEILARPLDAPVAAETGLAPGNEIAPWVARLGATDTDLLLVGHQPFVTRLATRLLTAREDPPCVLFSPGSVLCLERVEALWGIRWMLATALLTRVGPLPRLGA